MPEYINIAGFLSIAALLWKMTRDVSDKIDAAENTLNGRIDSLYSSLLNKNNG